MSDDGSSNLGNHYVLGVTLSLMMSKEGEATTHAISASMPDSNQLPRWARPQQSVEHLQPPQND